MRRNSREAVRLLRQALDDESSYKGLFHTICLAIRELESCDCNCCDARECHCGGICVHR